MSLLGISFPDNVGIRYSDELISEVRYMGLDCCLLPFNLEDDINTMRSPSRLSVLDENLDLSSLGLRVGKSTIELLSSENVESLLLGEREFLFQFGYVCHLSVPLLCIPFQESLGDFFASTVKNLLLNSQGRVPTILFIVKTDHWQSWLRFSNKVGNSRNIVVGLELPDIYSDFSKWISQSLHSIFIPESAFILNKKNIPLLSPEHRNCVSKAFELNLKIFIKSETVEDFKVHVESLQLLNRPRDNSAIERAANEYCDVLQIPLQPLKDNLDAGTYSVFEADPVKYIQYEKAITKALNDWKLKNANKTARIYVLGAGRGPLVNRAISASKTSNVDVEIVALDKNPNAVVKLLTMKENEWKNENVSVYEGDMRNFSHSKCDFLVSELLGSFGDNELSPECLDGCSQLMSSESVSIPANSVSYISLVSSVILFKNACALSFGSKGEHPLEIPYVVRYRNAVTLCKPRPVFSFIHPNVNNNDHSRYAKIEMKNEKHYNVVCHGFTGYFSSLLYDTISVSTVPGDETTNMYSWFPMYFPTKEPFMLSPQSTCYVSLWRKCDRTRVWYEWCFETSNFSSSIHNSNGDSYFIGLY